MFFSTATRPTVRKIGRGRSSVHRRARPEQFRVDAARPQLARYGSRASPSSCTSVGVAAITAAPGRGNGAARPSHVDVQRGIGSRSARYSGKRVWKLVVKGMPRLHADAAHGMADRPFGGDVDGVGPRPVEPAFDVARAGQRQPDFRIARHRQRPEPVRAEQLHARAPSARASRAT